MKNPLFTENSENGDHDAPNMLMRKNTSTSYLLIKEIIDVGLAGLKGKLETITSEKTECHLFLRNLYIMNS